MSRFGWVIGVVALGGCQQLGGLLTGGLHGDTDPDDDVVTDGDNDGDGDVDTEDGDGDGDTTEDDGDGDTDVDYGASPEVQEPVILDCNTDAGYEVNSWQSESAGPTPLFLAGIYETHSQHSGGNHPMGEAHVVFDLPGTHALALSSYEPVTWNLEIGPDTRIERVIVVGYLDQEVRGLDPQIPVEIVEQTACGYSLPYNGQGCDTDALIAVVEEVSGLEVTRFDGCYQASEFRWTSPAVPDPEPVPCGPDSEVELSYDISAIHMNYGASDPGGAGVCSGLVRFGRDLSQIQTAAMMNETYDGVVQVPYNGFAAQCDAVHCNALTHADGEVEQDMCSLYAVCEDGFARATGYTW